jgi:hypothetical protein
MGFSFDHLHVWRFSFSKSGNYTSKWASEPFILGTISSLVGAGRPGFEAPARHLHCLPPEKAGGRGTFAGASQLQLHQYSFSLFLGLLSVCLVGWRAERTHEAFVKILWSVSLHWISHFVLCVFFVNKKARSSSSRSREQKKSSAHHQHNNGEHHLFLFRDFKSGDLVSKDRLIWRCCRL